MFIFTRLSGRFATIYYFYYGVTQSPTKNLGPIGSAVLTFIGNRRTDRKAKYIYRLSLIPANDYPRTFLNIQNLRFRWFFKSDFYTQVFYKTVLKPTNSGVLWCPGKKIGTLGLAVNLIGLAQTHFKTEIYRIFSVFICRFPEK